MANIILGCDSNGYNDAQCQNTVRNILQQNGHTVTNLPIAPGPFSVYSYSSAGKGKIGIYLIAAGTTSISDFYYGGTRLDSCYFGIRGDIPGQNAGTEPGFSTRPIGKDPDCSSYCDRIAGLTFAQMNAKLKDRVQIVGGGTPEEIGRNLASAIAGGPASGGGSSSSSSGGTSNGLQSGSSNVSPLLQGDMTFEELVGEICNGIDLTFLTKRSTVVVDDFESIYAEAKYLRDHNSEVVEGENIKLWQLEEDTYELEVNQHGFYNTVYVTYKGGVVKESYDEFVRVYGEIPIRYKHPNLGKSDAVAKAKAYLAAHVRDFGMTVNLSMLADGDIDIGDIITVENPMTRTNENRALQGRDPEFLFVNGKSINWEGDSYLSADLECVYAPTSPQKLEVPTSGIANGSSQGGSSSNGGSTGGGGGTSGMIFNSCGQSSDGKYVLSISQPSSGRMEGLSYSTTYATVFVNKCPRCGKAELKWDSGQSGANCITCGGYHGSKSSWGNISEGEVSCNSCCSDFCGATGWEKDGSFASRLSTYKKPVASSKTEAHKLSLGNYQL